MCIYAIIIFFEPIFMEILNFFFSRHPFCWEIKGSKFLLTLRVSPAPDTPAIQGFCKDGSA